MIKKEGDTVTISTNEVEIVMHKDRYETLSTDNKVKILTAHRK
jgi:hypothetical protein